MAKQSLPERMAAAAADAVKLTDVYFCETLDFSEDSVATIERLVDDIEYSMPGGKTPDNVELLYMLWGAYVGEVFRRNVGGEWKHREEPGGLVITFRLGNTEIYPHEKVRKRLEQGAEHNLWNYYQVMRDLMAPGE